METVVYKRENYQRAWSGESTYEYLIDEDHSGAAVLKIHYRKWTLMIECMIA